MNEWKTEIDKIHPPIRIAIPAWNNNNENVNHIDRTNIFFPFPLQSAAGEIK